MKNKGNSKLRLHKDTVRDLQTAELSRIVGQGTVAPSKGMGAAPSGCGGSIVNKCDVAEIFHIFK